MPKKPKGNTTKILVMLDENENKRVEVYRSINNLHTKQDAIKQIIRKSELRANSGAIIRI